MTRFLTGLFLSGLFLSGLFFPHLSLYAQKSPSGLTVSPAFQEIVFDQKDGKKDFSVSISNTTEVPVTLRVAVFDFGSLDESGGVAFLGASNDLGKKYTLASWMHPEKDVLTIESGTTESIPVTIENQETLSPGGHYGALTFKTEDSPRGADAGDMVSVNQLFSTLVFVKKIGGEIYRLELKDSEYESNPLRFEETLRLRFRNTGNVHAVPRGSVTVSDPLGRIVAKGIINQESSLILPETMRVYPVRLDTLKRSLLPGRYTMEIAYRYDGMDTFTTTSLSFDFIPPPAILGFLLFIATGGWYVAKRRRQTGEKKALSRPIGTKQGDV